MWKLCKNRHKKYKTMSLFCNLNNTRRRFFAFFFSVFPESAFSSAAASLLSSAREVHK